jgi:hypothetical protein
VVRGYKIFVQIRAIRGKNKKVLKKIRKTNFVLKKIVPLQTF